MIKKITKKELEEYMNLHDRICQSCSGCRPDRKSYPKVCSFTEGYKRGQKELREKLKEVIG